MGLCQSSSSVNTYDLNSLDDTIELFSLENQKFEAKIVRVYDGDTCFAAFIWNNKPVKFKIRMENYDSPEMKPLLSLKNRDEEIEAGKKAKSELERLILNKIITLECGKWDKYGRLLGKICVKENNKIIYVNDHMIKNGFGVPYDGGKKPVFVSK